MPTNLVGKIVDIKGTNDYGIITYYDGEDYHIVLHCKDLETAKSYSSMLYSRDEFIVKKEC